MTATAAAGPAEPADVAPPPAVAPPDGPGQSATWLWDELGLSVDVRHDILGVGLTGLVGLALRRNPRRAQLLVSRVLGKHLPVRPELALAAGQVLADQLPPPAHNAPLVIGYCETATSLGHAVADGLAGSDYLHTTRRRVAGRVPLLEFAEAHSHADFHWLMPAEPELLADPRPLVLVDDELSTGRTALGTIRALHRHAPHPSYTVATLFDARPADARLAFDELAATLGVPIEVVSLLAGDVVVPADIAERATKVRARFPASAASASADAWPPLAAADGAGPGASLPARRHRLRRVLATWPADLPDGARHGWTPDHRARLPAVVASVAGEVSAGLTPGGRTLVLGTEELMYVPLRIAAALTGAEVVYHSTTRSPVHVIDVDGYAIRSRLSFPAPDDPARISHVYNVRPGLYDDIVVIIDPIAGGDPGGVHTAGMLGGLRGCAAVTMVTIPSYVPVR